MPATLTGRGAQVVLDPIGDHAKAARGAYATSLEANTQKRRDDVAAGLVPDGNTSDGRDAIYSGPATDLAVAPGVRTLNPPVSAVGNGADTTEDTLQTFVIPAGTFRKVGDQLRIVAAGTMAATTDNRVSRLKFGGTNIANIVATGSTATAWRLDAQLIKTGLTGFTCHGVGFATQSNVSATPVGLSLDNTVPITILVTGQNNTTAAANSINCNFLSVQFFPA
jgi:hypothetical protein